MSILVNKDSRVVVQGITGSEGEFHAKQMLDYGTNIVAGVTPGKGGVKTLNEAHPDVPIITASLDRQLNDIGYIMPGLGDAGDRMFGTK